MADWPGLPPHLPEALELPLFDTEQLAGLPADNGSVPWCVIQDGLPEGRPDSQGANGDCILHAKHTCSEAQQQNEHDAK